MFPSNPTDNPKELVTELRRHLQQAGENYADSECLRMKDGYLIILHMISAIAPAATKPAAQYIRQYAKSRGWSVKQIAFGKNYLRFVLSSAASSASTKR